MNFWVIAGLMGIVQQVFDMYSSGVGILNAEPNLPRHVIIRSYACTRKRYKYGSLSNCSNLVGGAPKFVDAI